MIKALLVDDEPNCCESLEWQLKHYCSNVNVVGICHTSEEAIRKIIKEKPDVVFMDVQLHDLTGFDVLNQLENIDFNVVFVTAHEDHAIRAIRFNAIDYLLKPVRPEELKQAIDRVAKSVKEKSRLSHDVLDYLSEITHRQPKEVRRIAFSTSESIQFVNIDDIVFCKGESNYTQVTLATGQKILLSKTLKSIEELLDKGIFYRVHNSYLINLNRVIKYVRNDAVILMDNQATVPLSQSKKDDFLKIFSGL